MLVEVLSSVSHLSAEWHSSYVPASNRRQPFWCKNSLFSLPCLNCSGIQALLLDFCLTGTQLALGSAMYSRTFPDFDESFQLDCLLKVQRHHEPCLYNDVLCVHINLIREANEHILVAGTASLSVKYPHRATDTGMRWYVVLLLLLLSSSLSSSSSPPSSTRFCLACRPSFYWTL